VLRPRRGGGESCWLLGGEGEGEERVGCHVGYKKNGKRDSIADGLLQEAHRIAVLAKEIANTVQTLKKEKEAAIISLKTMTVAMRNPREQRKLLFYTVAELKSDLYRLV